MTIEIRNVYDRLRKTPFPELGKQVGDFPLYDSLLAGCANRASRGEPIAASEVPEPDDETTKFVAALLNSETCSEPEQAFLSYFDLLEQLRALLQRHGVH